MTPIELKQWQAGLGLSEAAMAHYLGVPVHTLRGWIKGTRKPDAAPLRLIEVLQWIAVNAPLYCARGYFVDKTLTPDSFKIEEPSK